MSQLQDMDVQVFFKGDTINVIVDNTLARNKWRGGLFVNISGHQFNTTSPYPVVTKSNGVNPIGFLVRSSEEVALSEYNYTSLQPSVTRVVLVYYGNCQVLLKQFETVAFNTGMGLRDGGAGNVAYTHNQLLSVSENGLVTSLDDATDAFSVLYPASTPKTIGQAWAIPDTTIGNRLGILTNL